MLSPSVVSFESLSLSELITLSSLAVAPCVHTLRLNECRIGLPRRPPASLPGEEITMAFRSTPTFVGRALAKYLRNESTFPKINFGKRPPALARDTLGAEAPRRCTARFTGGKHWVLPITNSIAESVSLVYSAFGPYGDSPKCIPYSDPRAFPG